MDKLRIVLDNIIFFLQRSGGGTIYWMEIISRASKDSEMDVRFSEPKGNCSNNFRPRLNLKVNLVETLPINWLRLTNFSLPLKEKSIFHSSYYRISSSKHAINIVTIHDFTSEFFFKGIRKFIHLNRKKKAIKRAAGIICISNNTKNDLLNLYPAVDKNKIKVIYNGVGEEYRPLEKKNLGMVFSYSEILKQKYIIYVGHRTNYKNFFIACQTVSLLSQNFRFLIIGEKLTRKETGILDCILKERYTSLSGIENETLNVFYNFAFCLIYPSSYEGFGIPIVEAMKAGCPVVTSNKSSIPEVTGSAAEIVTEIEPESFKTAILKLNDIHYRDNLIEKGKMRAKLFSWDKCYKEVKDFYVEVYNKHK